MMKPKPKAKAKKKVANNNMPIPELGYMARADAAAAARSQDFATEDKRIQDAVKSGVKASAAEYAQKEKRVQNGVCAQAVFSG